MTEIYEDKSVSGVPVQYVILEKQNKNTVSRKVKIEKVLLPKLPEFS
jgi:hypothetical protein